MQGELLGPKRERASSRIPFLPAHCFTNYIQVTSARAGGVPGRELSPAGKAAHLGGPGPVRAGGKGDACGGTRGAWSAASSLLKRSQLVPEKVQGKKKTNKKKKL